MAGGLFDKAIRTYETLFGTDDLRAALEDEQAENTWLLDEIGGLKAEIHTLRSLLESARQETRAVQQLLEEERRSLRKPQVDGDTVRKQYGEMDAWMDAAKDVL